MDSWQTELDSIIAQHQRNDTVREQRQAQAQEEAHRFLSGAVAPVFQQVADYLQSRHGRTISRRDGPNAPADPLTALILIYHREDLELRYEARVRIDGLQALPIVAASSPGVDFSDVHSAAIADAEHRPGLLAVTQDDVRADLLRHYRYALEAQDRDVTGGGEP